MSAAQRDGWPPSQQPGPAPGPQQTEQPQGQGPRQHSNFATPSNANPQPPAQASPAQGADGSVLPPPTAPFYSSTSAAAHNQTLPALATMSSGAPPQPSPHLPSQRPPSEPGPAAISAQGNPAAPPFSLPGISQTLQQPPHQHQNPANMDREREMRERDARDRQLMESHVEQMAAQQHAAAQQEEALKRAAEQREREMRERQQMEQGVHENHIGLQLHQPVAVAPSNRTVLGPNGILSQNLGPVGPVAPGMAGQNAHAIFANAPIQQGDATPRMQHAHAVHPPPQAAVLMPFNGPQGPMAMGQGQQPILNDALSYLDQVKVQFADHPDVYNKFLDIMKDFKSGAIDTPGVIERVSTLFAGNPDLIQGFNTFLPPGYKIECGTNGDPNNIRVTTPMGTMVSHLGAVRALSPPRSNAATNGASAPGNENPFYDSGPNRQWQPAGRSQAPEGQDAIFSPNNRNMGLPLFGNQQPVPLSPEANRHHADAAASAAALAHQQEQRGVSQLQNAVSAAAGRSILSPSGDGSMLHGQAINGAIPAGGLGPEKRGPVEFNHAISYVNKIKNRFAQQPDIYKQFLEILQTYQRESKPIQDVYAQVTSLFSTAPDLLEDFKQFLPESAAQHRAQQQAARHAAEDAAMLNSVRGEAVYAQAGNHQQTPRADASRLPPMGNFAPTPTANRDNKRKRGERPGPAAGAVSGPSVMQQEVPTSNVRGGYGPSGVNKRAKTGHGVKQTIMPDGPPVSPTLIPALPEPLPPTTTPMPSQDELAFFDRVKKFLGNKNSMNEFLKLCNLFTQDLIDKQLFIYRAQAFIGGNPELFAWFKHFLGLDDEVSYLTRPRTINARVSLSNCRSYGPSYRLLPKRERERVCSGRDELCRSVLNDEWASHPTWASEDSGFVAHRKNQYEEGLHRIEEERHDYDFNIEACTRTIQQLEPIANQLLNLKGEDRTNFVLSPGLGGPSETIYKRVIMKIYGRDKGKDVINELFNTPWSVVPVLLHRLKSKLEDWKAAQREWEKVWRDQTQKIFWRSLDHQSLSIKQQDKRQFQPKSLQNEIQVKYEEQKRRKDIQELPQPDYQFAFSFRDEDVLYDAARLMLTFAENNTTADFTRVISFIKEFIPLFFGLDSNKFEQRVQTYGRELSTNENESGDDTPSPDDDMAQRPQKAKKGDLRRGVLDPRGKRKEKEGSVASASRDTTPDVTSAAEDENGGDSSHSQAKDEVSIPARWVEHVDKLNSLEQQETDHEEPYRRNQFNMYANSTIYCFFRLFVFLYERLLKLKDNEDNVRRVVQRAKAHKAAHELKMMDKTPDDFFKDTSESANYYVQVLDMLQEQILGDIDMNQIEETLRRYYLQVGWQLYTFDRLMSSLVRFALAVVNNDNKEKTLEIYRLFKADRVADLTTHKSELSYRKAVDKLTKDTDTYRIAYDPARQQAQIRLMKRDEPTFDFDTVDPSRRWRAYIASYTAREPTEQVDQSRVSAPYAKRNLPKGEEADEAALGELVTYEEKLRITTNVGNYQLGFPPGEPAGGNGVFFFINSGVTAGTSDEDVKPTGKDFKAVQEQRHDRARDVLVRNTKWMKDLAPDEVNALETAFQEHTDDARAPASDGADVDMAETQ
ncbi:hypothetical protein M011DRAFT_464421 [Sporormia fimetaria CBS 119925]|uniref:Histone deacetylase interacting domain-containing protein n=1 Tax=Sporormia fimetaria CBS 119925 TaxID=1340428 RepID=A0A6A6VJ17_9PLEO|nr:hypothetical protein M011DRAFT_464421 [Sporormia fimetaria CBS 119925]